MMNVHRVLGLGLAVLVSAPAHVQTRTGQPATLAPQAPMAALPPEVINPFRDAYRAAGRPRIVLFWNVAFDDETEAARQSVDVTRSEHSYHRSEDEPYAADDLGSESSDRVIHTHTTRVVDSRRGQATPLSPRELAELDTAFRNELRRGEMRLLDRDKAVRFTQAEQDRAGVDPKLIETDAVRGKADLLLEVLLVRDGASPFGRGFKIALTDVKTGSELASFYTAAQPNLATPAGRYVGTDQGFEWQQPPASIPSPTQVGVELADEVMQSLGPVLGNKTARTHD